MIQLENLKVSDFERLNTYLFDEELARYYMLPILKNEEEKEAFLKRMVKRSMDEEIIFKGIYHENKLIGYIHEVFKEDRRIEIGYLIFKPYQRKGYAYKALKAFIELLKTTSFEIVEAGAFIQNEASIQLLLKAGFKKTDKTEEISYRESLHQCLYFEFVLQ